MNTTVLYFSVIGDLAYEISRNTLRFASVLFLAYVLTLAIALMLTWRPKRQKIVAPIETVTVSHLVMKSRISPSEVAAPVRSTPRGIKLLPGLSKSKTPIRDKDIAGDGKLEVGK